MTNNDEAYEMLQTEYDELDIPMLSADTIVLALTELLERDEVFAAYDRAVDWNNQNKNALETLIAVLMDNAIDSSLQFAHIRRGMEIQFEMNDLENAD